MKRSKNVVVVHRSCITGNIVWIYRGSSQEGARFAYWRTCKKEIERVKNWNKNVVEPHRRSVEKLISLVTSSLSLTAKLTPEQQDAAKKLKKIEKNPPVCDMQFYDHIMEERRRRSEDREIRRQMREREAAEKAEKEMQQNSNYDK